MKIQDEQKQYYPCLIKEIKNILSKMNCIKKPFPCSEWTKFNNMCNTYPPSQQCMKKLVIYHNFNTKTIKNSANILS